MDTNIDNYNLIIFTIFVAFLWRAECAGVDRRWINEHSNTLTIESRCLTKQLDFGYIPASIYPVHLANAHLSFSISKFIQINSIL